MEQEKVDLGQKLTSAQGELEKSLTEANNLKNTLEVVEEDLKNAKEELKNKGIDTGKLDLLTQQIRELQDELKLSSKEVEMAQEEITALEEENTELKDKIKQLEKQLRSLSEQLAEESKDAKSASDDIDSILLEYINEETNIQSYVEKVLRYYDVDMPVTSEQKASNKMFYSVTIGEKKLNCKVNNGKFYVKGGGGWYTLQDYIEKFIIKMQASKKHGTFKNIVVGY